MSLDVSLNIDTPIRVEPGSGIFVRDGGVTKEIAREEWDKRCPGREPVIYRNPETETTEVFSYNITHNLGEMAKAAGLYTYLWQPEEEGITKAVELIDPLATGLTLLIRDPRKFKAMNPPNGWGTYENLVQFVKDYLKACIEYPDAKVSACR